MDEHSVMTYLSQFPKAKLKPGAPLKPKLNPKKARAYGRGKYRSCWICGLTLGLREYDEASGEGSRNQEYRLSPGRHCRPSSALVCLFVCFYLKGHLFMTTLFCPVSLGCKEHCWLNVPETDGFAAWWFTVLTLEWRKGYCSHFSDEDSEAWPTGSGRWETGAWVFWPVMHFFLWLC